jgi:protein-disulfide isomerase
LPQIHKELIEPGKLRIVYRDFPLDQVALAAAMVARALPANLYEPFVLSLLASQDRWAFAGNVNSNEELWKRAALAGLSRAAFNATLADTGFRDALLKMQDADAKTYNVDSTPSFIFNGSAKQGVLKAGEISFADFASVAEEVSGSKG